MSITVIDQGPELYWFVSNALLQTEIPLKHIQSVDTAEKYILHDLPEIVIINGDDKSLQPEKFISKIRNHVFARNTLFIVFTADTSIEFKKALLIAGAGQVLYRGRSFSPSPKYFATLVKWFLNFKTPDAQLFDFKPVPFQCDAEFTSYGRIGWISKDQCLIETNVDLNPGQSIEFYNTLFEDLEIKNLRLECIEKNKVGRYYQYSNSLLCKILSKDPVKDSKKIETWIQNNADISKQKPVKVVYFESDPEYRAELKAMMKTERQYCARGYESIKDLTEVLNYQIPHLVMINRAIIQKDKAKFEALKNFMKNNFCYCVTYSTSEIFGVEEFKKNYPFAMHSPSTISIELLDSMVKKLEEKLPDHLKPDDKKVFLSKHSAYSRISLHSHARVTELAMPGIGLVLPFALSNFCACEITCSTFSLANIGRSQFFRSFSNKLTAAGVNHRLIFMGQTIKENEQVKDVTEKIAKVGFDRWLKGDVDPLMEEKGKKSS